MLECCTLSLLQGARSSGVTPLGCAAAAGRVLPGCFRALRRDFASRVAYVSLVLVQWRGCDDVLSLVLPQEGQERHMVGRTRSASECFQCDHLRSIVPFAIRLFCLTHPLFLSYRFGEEQARRFSASSTSEEEQAQWFIVAPSS